MPFLQSKKNKKYKFKSMANSLRTYLEILLQNRSAKRVSSFTSFKLKASMTVEASIVLPLFIFFIIQVMSAINMIAVQSRLEAALHQTGNKMAFSGYLQKNVAEYIPIEGFISEALNEAYAKNGVLDHAGKEYLNKSCIKGGSGGISFNGTSIMGGNDVIEINLSYYVQPLFPVFGFDGFNIMQCYYGRAWTGYDVESTISDLHDEDPMVYITETGTVYHTNRNCTYLNPSVTSSGLEEVFNKRNQSGRKYLPCSICVHNYRPQTVYITNQGSSYHASITCSGLKRTIYTIPLSQAGGRRKCTKCS